MNDEQLDSDVTIELDNKECFTAELRIADFEHESLDCGHPILFVHLSDKEQIRKDSIKDIAIQIGLI